MRPQFTAMTSMPDESIQFNREMGLECVSLMLKPEELTKDAIMSAKRRFAGFGLTISDAASLPMQKNTAIHLGFANRDDEIQKFIDMLKVMGECEIPFTSIAWQPHGVLRTGNRAEAKRGGISSFAEEAEILARPNAEDRVFSDDEIWDNFKYFIDKVLPVCENTGVKMALHPNDPPLARMAGVPSLIYSTECYRKAFEIADGSSMLGIKLCVGCWLEGGDKFGDILSDIEYFVKGGRVLVVHFRNVSSTLPNFQETLAEDGYADMYAIMKKLVECGCDAVISYDHAFRGYDSLGGCVTAGAYPMGYLKGLMHAAKCELGKR